jgi:hypothetical protein
MLNDEELKKFEERLEAEGEEKVSKGLAMGRYGVISDPLTKAPLVKAWLDKKEAQRQEAKRQEEIGVSKEANRIAKEANQISKSAKNAYFGKTKKVLK